LIQVYKALGGGWEIRLGQPAPAAVAMPAPQEQGMARPPRLLPPQAGANSGASDTTVVGTVRLSSPAPR
jgi:hypothetical protein